MVKKQTKKTKFVYCEGDHDRAFMQHLYNLYKYEDRLPYKVKKGKGKDQMYILNDAIRYGNIYDEIVIKLDGDRSKIEMNKVDNKISRLQKEKIVISVLRSYPCIESLLIKILEPSKNISSMGSDGCKRYFENKYISKSHRSDIKQYKDKFPKKLLDKRRTQMPELDNLIKVFGL